MCTKTPCSNSCVSPYAVRIEYFLCYIQMWCPLYNLERKHHLSELYRLPFWCLMFHIPHVPWFFGSETILFIMYYPHSNVSGRKLGYFYVCQWGTACSWDVSGCLVQASREHLCFAQCWHRSITKPSQQSMVRISAFLSWIGVPSQTRDSSNKLLVHLAYKVFFFDQVVYKQVHHRRWGLALCIPVHPAFDYCLLLV